MSSQVNVLFIIIWSIFSLPRRYNIKRKQFKKAIIVKWPHNEKCKFCQTKYWLFGMWELQGNVITMINARANSYNNDTWGRRRINQTFVIIFWHKYINYFLFVLPYFFFFWQPVLLWMKETSTSKGKIIFMR